MSQPDAPTPAEYVLKIQAARTPDEVLVVLREIRERPPVFNPTVAETLRAYFEFRAATLTGERTVTAHAQVAGAQGTALDAEARVTKPTLMQQYATLPCGQQIAVLVVILLVLLSVDLPRDVQDQIWGLITVLGAAIWVIGRITKS